MYDFFLFFFKCIYVDVCLQNLNQYILKEKISKSLSNKIALSFYLCNGCPKSIKATFNKIFSFAMFSGASNATLHKVFIVQCCPRRYTWGSIAQIITPVRCCPRSSKQHCTSKNPMQCCSWGSKQLCIKKFLCNVVLILLGQYCIGKNPMQFCLRGLRKNPVQCCLTTLETTLHSWKPYAVLSRRLQQLCIRKHPVQCCLNTLGTTLHRAQPYAVLFKRLQTTCIKKNPVQCCLDPVGITLCSWKPFVMLPKRL